LIADGLGDCYDLFRSLGDQQIRVAVRSNP
jgi:hypothetical protein